MTFVCGRNYKIEVEVLFPFSKSLIAQVQKHLLDIYCAFSNPVEDRKGSLELSANHSLAVRLDLHPPLLPATT